MPQVLVGAHAQVIAQTTENSYRIVLPSLGIRAEL